VLSIDEKPSIQALERSQGYLMSCPRFSWTPICPVGGRCGEVQHGQDQTK
jgi:hypothetical protein